MGAAYGASATSIRSFTAWFAVVTAVVFAYATNPQLANYNVDSVRIKLLIATIIAVSAFGLSRAYSIRSEEYKVNRLKRLFLVLAVADFFMAILIMDPPEWLQAFASYCSDIPLLGDLLSPLTSPGVPASVWGGLFVNIIVAMAGCVLGLVVGIFLAFGRQSKLPIVKWPSVSIIEIVRPPSDLLAVLRHVSSSRRRRPTIHKSRRLRQHPPYDGNLQHIRGRIHRGGDQRRAAGSG